MRPARSCHSYCFDGDFLIGGQPLFLSPSNSTAWDGGVLLAKYLEQEFGPASSGRQLSCLDLGTGTGVAGLSFAMLGHRVLLSDVGDGVAEVVHGHIEQNHQVINAAGGLATYEEIDWKKLPQRDRFGTFDVVFAADVLYNCALPQYFVQALAWATTGSRECEVIVAHKMRTKCNIACDLSTISEFEKLAKSHGLVVVRSTKPEIQGNSNVSMFHLRKCGARQD